MAGRWSWPFTSSVKVGNEWSYISSPPHTLSKPVKWKYRTLYCHYVSVETYSLYRSQKYFVIVGRWRHLSVVLRRIAHVQSAETVDRCQYVAGTTWGMGTEFRGVFGDYSVTFFGQSNSRLVLKTLAYTGRKSDTIQLMLWAQTFLNCRRSSRLGFGDLTPFSLSEIYQHFGVICHLHIQRRILCLKNDGCFFRNVRHFCEVLFEISRGWKNMGSVPYRATDPFECYKSFISNLPVNLLPPYVY